MPAIYRVGFSMLGDIGGGGLVNSWYSLTTFQIYENKQIPEGEQINESQ